MIRKIKELPNELILGISIVGILLLVAIFAPLIAPYNYTDLLKDNLHEPSSNYLFGTDGIGRDVFSMVVYGTRTSLFVGVTAALLSMIIGTIVGAISGYFTGKIDIVISEIINIFSMVPTLFLIIMIIAIFGSSIRNVVIVIGLTSWPGTARVMRAQTKAIKEMTFIKAARVIGESDKQIIIKHIVPHGISPVLVNAAMSVSSAILDESSLAFLGLGDPNVVSWGQVINLGKKYILSGWWVMTFPGIAIAITVYAFHMIGEGLNIYLNPQKSRSF